MKKRDKLSNPSFRELARLGLACADAAKRHIEQRQAKTHAAWVEADKKLRATAKAILTEKLWEQPTLFEESEDAGAES